MTSYTQPLSHWTEPMLEGRYAELSAGIECGEYTGAVLQEAITERRRVWLEIVRCRVGEIDDEEVDEWREAAEWERLYFGAEGEQ